MEHINEILRKQKVVAKNFICPQCKEDGAYTYFDFESKIHRWKCPTCGKEDFLMNLNYGK